MKRRSLVLPVVVLAFLLAATAPASAEDPPPLVPATQPPPDPDAPGAPFAPAPNAPARDAPPPPPKRCTISGTARADVLRGTARSDVICGRGGTDRIFARGSDAIVAGPGNDVVFARNGTPDIVYGGPGRDRAVVDAVMDELVGVESAQRGILASTADGHLADVSGGWLGPNATRPGAPRVPVDRTGQVAFPMYQKGWHAHPQVGPLVSTSDNDSFCSASLVARNIVVTAAHCVYLTGEEVGGVCLSWDDLRPQYRSGAISFMPKRWGNQALGKFPTRQVVMPAGWEQAIDNCDVFPPLDYAFVILGPNSAGQQAGDVAGWMGLATEYQGLWYWAIGYPETGYFAAGSQIGGGGVYPHYCLSKLGGPSDPMPFAGATWWEIGIGCYMTGGASGGPWIVDAANNGRWQYVASVSSHCWPVVPLCKDTTGKNMWGPYFTRYVLDLFAYAQRQ